MIQSLNAGKQHAFNPDLLAGRYTFILEAYIGATEEGRFVFHLLALPMSAHPFLDWYWSLFLQDFSIYRRPAEIPRWG